MLSTRLIFPSVVGFFGAAILFWLGSWQMDRLEWKERVIADIEARVDAAPVGIPDAPQVDNDRYLPVEVSGTFLENEITVLASTKQVGAMYRIIAPFRTDGGRMIMIDRGFVLDELRDRPRPKGAATLVGNLYWPDEVDSFTPEPDLDAGIWFARDIPNMARALGTEPVLLVVRRTSQSGNGITPLPVDTSLIPNKHFEYAVTWYGLGIVWLAMSGLMIWRQLRKDEG
ncbi:MAG: SURF1 family protein [Paracoccaceae bacterium]|nr:SURF1 family protein [Paracoccaceae bacterium]MDP7185873.1 SURF1 family protein [Paracoccaceae bacterium]